MKKSQVDFALHLGGIKRTVSGHNLMNDLVNLCLKIKFW